MLPLLAALALAADPAPDWDKPESQYLSNIRQVTRDFVRAGEGYFSPDGKTDHLPGRGEGHRQSVLPDLHHGPGHRQVHAASAPASARRPAASSAPTARRSSSPAAISTPTPRSKYADGVQAARGGHARPASAAATSGTSIRTWTSSRPTPTAADLKRLTDAKGYDAEGSYSPDGKQIVFCSNRGGADNLELYIMDADGKNVRQLTNAPGCYNGGPFFSPDGKQVIFRSDRKKKDHLQLYVINADGTASGR